MPYHRVGIPSVDLPRLLIPKLSGFYAQGQRATYVLLRIAFGLTIVTHGVPKLMGRAHGSMANPMQGATNLIETVLDLPFAPMLAFVVASLETFGGMAVAAGFATRFFAPMLAIQMAFVCFALAPTFSWIDRGIEYPLMLGFIALYIAMRGGGPASVDGRLGPEL